MVKDVGSPALKIQLDTFHANIEEKDQAAAIEGGQTAGPRACAGATGARQATTMIGRG
jgi:hydroxypyruvate isomerase